MSTDVGRLKISDAAHLVQARPVQQFITVHRVLGFGREYIEGSPATICLDPRWGPSPFLEVSLPAHESVLEDQVAYEAEISRKNPVAMVFLVDQSTSMKDPFGTGELVKSKAEEVATVVNRLIHNLVIKATKSEEKPRDYFHIGFIGYGEIARVGLPGFSRRGGLIPIGELGQQPLRIVQRPKKVPDGAGGLVEQMIKFPEWVDPLASGSTPMCGALQAASQLLAPWIAEHPDSYPPAVINITDGEGNDGDPLVPARELASLQTRDGNVVLFNIHITGSPGQPIFFPSARDGLPDDFAKLLFEMSSVLPPPIAKEASREGLATGESPRGFCFKGDLVSLIKFLDIGTRPGELR